MHASSRDLTARDALLVCILEVKILKVNFVSCQAEFLLKLNFLSVCSVCDLSALSGCCHGRGSHFVSVKGMEAWQVVDAILNALVILMIYNGLVKG